MIRATISRAGFLTPPIRTHLLPTVGEAWAWAATMVPQVVTDEVEVGELVWACKRMQRRGFLHHNTVRVAVWTEPEEATLDIVGEAGARRCPVRGKLPGDIH